MGVTMQKMVQGGSFDSNGGSYDYGLEVRAGQRYMVELRAVSDWPLGGLHLSTFDLERGSRLHDAFSTDRFGGVTRLVFTAEKDGLQHVNARGWGPDGETLNFELVAREIPADDHADLPAQATPLGVGQTLAGELDWAGDVDCFRVSLKAGQPYQLTLHGDDPAALQSAMLALQAIDGSRVQSYFDAIYGAPVDGCELLFTPAVDGIYTLQVDSPMLQATGSYSLSLQTRASDDHGDLPAQASGLTIGHSEQGRIDGPGDADCFSIVAEAGQRIAVSVRPVNLEAAQSDAPQLSLTMPNTPEGLAGYGSIGGLRPQFVFTAPADGVYTARVDGLPGHGWAGDLYRIDAQLLPADDAPDFGVGKALMLGLAQPGVLDTGADKDVYSTWLQAGQRYRLTLVDEAGDSAAQGLDSFWLYALSADGQEGLGSELQESGERSLVLQPASSGGYDFTVMRWPGADLPAAHYQLQLETIGKDDHADNAGLATAVALEADMPGRMDSPDDVDYFAIPVKAGVGYWISAEVPMAGEGQTASLAMLSMLSVYLQGDANLQTGYWTGWLDRDGSGVSDAYFNEYFVQPSVDGTVIAHVSALPGASVSYTLRATTMDGHRPFIEEPQDGGQLQVGGPSDLGRFVDGTSGNDSLHGTPLDDRLRGGDGNDVLIGGGGRDLLLGGDGIDTAVIPVSKYEAMLQLELTSGSWPVNDRDRWHINAPLADAAGAAKTGVLTLQGVERLQFTDEFLALDMGGHAGTVARLMTVLFGAREVVTDWGSAGIGLAWLDAGRSAESLAAAALADWAFPQRTGSQDSIGQWLWICRNAGGDPEQQGQMFSHGVDALMHGQPLAGLVIEAAQSLGVTQQLELMGLPQSGLSYEPAPPPVG